MIGIRKDMESKKMNILIICERENNPFIGGIEHVDYSLTREWLAAGCSVVWLSATNSGATIPYTPLVEQYFMPDGKNADAQANVDCLLSLIEKYQIQVIVNQATIRKDIVALCLAAKKALGVKLVSCFHFAPRVEYDIAKNNIFIFRGGFSVKTLIKSCADAIAFYLYRGRNLKNKEKAVLKSITSSSDIVVVESERYIRDFEKISGANNIRAMRNAMDAVQVDALPQKSNKILYCARLEYGMKRFDRMLRIWKKVEQKNNDWELIVIGSGDYKNYFVKMAADMKLSRINFLGFANPKAYYEQCPILCLTSTKEGSPMVIVESMQYGCIPVAYDSFAALADAAENDVTGYRIPPFKEAVYVDTLLKLMSDADLRQRLAKNCMKIPAQYDSKIIAPKWLELFEDMVGETTSE